jgi:H+/Cl- antiporter ClcA
VAALMGIPLVGTAYILELGRRHHAPLSVERVTAALVGGVVGLMNIALGVDVIRLVVPKEPPHTLAQAVITALLIGGLAGSITSMTGAAIYRAKEWRAHPVVRLAIGGAALAAAAVTVAIIADLTAAVGPGGSSITWVENTHTATLTVLAVTVLSAAATTAAAAAGGCGGLFVPFMAVGDLGGRVFSPGLRVPDDCRFLGRGQRHRGGLSPAFHRNGHGSRPGGPRLAVLTSLASVIVASFAGASVGSLLDRFFSHGQAYIAKRAHQH